MELNKIYNLDCLVGLENIPDKSIDLILTDPPYGIDYQSNHRIASEKFDKIYNDKTPFLGFIKHIPRILKEDGAVFIFTRWDVQQAFIDEMEANGLSVKNVVIWDKGNHTAGDLQRAFGFRYESIIYACGKDFAFKNTRPVDILRYPRVTGDKLTHPNEKPVGLLKYLIELTTEMGGAVLDCFMGSGATAVAAKECGRQYIGFELDENYHKKASARVERAAETLTLF